MLKLKERSNRFWIQHLKTIYKRKKEQKLDNYTDDELVVYKMLRVVHGILKPKKFH